MMFGLIRRVKKELTYKVKDTVIEFKAVITYERYYNDETSWGVYGFKTKDDIPYYEEKTVPNPFEDDINIDNDEKFSILAGKTQELITGGEYLVKAKYVNDKTYGHQYNPVSVYALIPQTKETQLLFLKSLISESQAENLVKAYPNVVNDVANGTLKEIDYRLVKGVREITWNKIKDKIISNYLISDIIVMLKPLGVTYTMIKKLLKSESNPVLLKQKIEKNPYILTRVDGLGFKKVDDLTLRFNPETVDSMERLTAFIKYYFTELGENNGHTWVSENILTSAVSNNVSECLDKMDYLMKNNNFLYVKDGKVGLKYYHDVEEKIRYILTEKAKKQTKVKLSDEQIEQAIKDAEKEQGFEYVPEQLEVIKKSLNRTVSIITGKAGCGKSSIMRAIIKGYTENNYTVAASALSAMAAQRITEASGFPASTIHRTLGCKEFNEFKFNKDNPLKADAVLLDEGSMVNAGLFLHWLEAVGDNTRIIISGDHKQLPPIGFGNIFSDLIDVFDDSVVSKLTKSMRQAEKSGILFDANIIRENKNPIIEKIQPKLIHGELKDMYYMFRENRQTLFNIAVKTFLKSAETDGIYNVVIAVPRRKDCLNSAVELNKVIQEKLLGQEEQCIESFDNSFKLGAKVTQTVNNYEKNVYNGEIGYITKIDERYEEGKRTEYCAVVYKDILGGEKIVEYTKKDLTNLDLAYAMTVHKLQGSGRKTVIGIIDNTHHNLLDNCMLYTMLTRAKERCLLLAEPEAFLKCIRTSHNRRNTWMRLKNN